MTPSSSYVVIIAYTPSGSGLGGGLPACADLQSDIASAVPDVAGWNKTVTVYPQSVKQAFIADPVPTS